MGPYSMVIHHHTDHNLRTLGFMWNPSASLPWHRKHYHFKQIFHYIYMLHTYTPTHLHTYTSTHLHTYTHTHIHTYTPTHLHTYTPTHLHIYTHTHLHTYTPTHLHTHTHSPNSITLRNILFSILRTLGFIWSHSVGLHDTESKAF